MKSKYTIIDVLILVTLISLNFIILLDFRWAFWNLLGKSVIYAQNVPISPSKIKNNINRMNKLIIKSSIKEKNLGTTKAFASNNKFGHTNPFHKIDPTSPEYHGRPIFEIFIRKRNEGFWQWYKDIACDPEYFECAINAANGGVLEESSRNQIEEGIKKKLYGMGMGGEKIVYSDVVSTLPQFKKVKLRDLSIGYKYQFAQKDQNNTNSENQNDDRFNDVIWTLFQEKIESKTLRVLSSSDTSLIGVIRNHSLLMEDDQNILLDSVDSINIQDIDRINIINQNILEYYKSIEIDKCDSISVCSDGSAQRIELNINDCDRNIFVSDHYFIAKCGVVLVASRGNDSYQLNINVTNNGLELIENPLHAELIGGAIAVHIVKLLEIYLSSQLSRTNSVVRLLSDSKVLVRVMKQLIEKSNNGQQLNRLVLDNTKDRIADILDSLLLSLVKGTLISFVPSWIPGHPERRDPIDKWTQEDYMIWTADNLCKASPVDIGNSSKFISMNEIVNVDFPIHLLDSIAHR